MIKRTFLKLEGLRGGSSAPRHIGDIEVWTDHFTFSRQQIRRAGPSDGRELEFNHVVLQKSSDESTMPLRLAYSKDHVFPSGELVVEEVNERGHLIRATVYKMRSIVIDKLEIMGHRVTLALNFESFSVAR